MGGWERVEERKIGRTSGVSIYTGDPKFRKENLNKKAGGMNVGFGPQAHNKHHETRGGHLVISKEKRGKGQKLTLGG